MKFLGLDGFTKGWVAVLLDGDSSELSFHADIADALRGPFDRAGIDIPIGMTEDGTRAAWKKSRNWKQVVSWKGIS